MVNYLVDSYERVSVEERMAPKVCTHNFVLTTLISVPLSKKRSGAIVMIILSVLILALFKIFVEVYFRKLKDIHLKLGIHVHIAIII